MIKKVVPNVKALKTARVLKETEDLHKRQKSEYLRSSKNKEREPASVKKKN